MSSRLGRVRVMAQCWSDVSIFRCLVLVVWVILGGVVGFGPVAEHMSWSVGKSGIAV